MKTCFNGLWIKKLDKKTCGVAIKRENVLGKEFAEKLHIAIIGKLKKRKVHSCFVEKFGVQI